MKASMFKKVLVIAAVVVCVSMVTGCVTGTTLGAAAGGHGLFAGFQGAEAAASGGASEIGSYMVLFGLIDIGYVGYANTVKQAVADGKEVSSVTKNWLILPVAVNKAYAK